MRPTPYAEDDHEIGHGELLQIPAWRHVEQPPLHPFEPALHPRLHIFFGTSQLHLDAKTGLNEEQALELMARSARLAVKLFGEVEFSPEDATRTREEFLLRTVQAVVDEGVKVVNIPDTVGYTVPSEYRARFQLLKSKIRGIDKVTLSPDHKTVLLGIAGLKPVMQMKVQMKLKSASGQPMDYEIYNTINLLP